MNFDNINHAFSKCVIIFCIFYMSHVTERALDIVEKTGKSTTDIITAATVFFGGELIMLAGKTVFSENNIAKIEKAKIEQAVITEPNIKKEGEEQDGNITIFN